MRHLNPFWGCVVWTYVLSVAKGNRAKSRARNLRPCLLRRDFRSGARNGGPRARSRRLGGRRGESRQRALEADWRAGTGAGGLEMRRGAKLGTRRFFILHCDGKVRQRGCFFIAGPGARHRRAGLGQAPCVSRWRPRGYPFTRYCYRGSLGPEERPPPRSGGPICGGRVRLWMRAITLCPQTAGPHRPAGWSKGRGIAGAQRRRRNHA